MGHYTLANISEESQKGTHLAFETVGYLAEAFVFVYLGISVMGMDLKDVPYLFSILMVILIMF